MHERDPSIHATRDPRAWAPILARYREPNCARSTVELVITAVPFVVLWILMWAALGTGYWVGLLLAVPAAGFLVRLFMIQHDCGHGSFFRRRRANDWVGRVIGVLTLTPYDFWRHSHALHHANSGNLDHRGFGDVDTLTVREFLALSRWRQLMYRLYRNPIVMFGVGPMYLFVLQHRLPVGLMRSSWHFWLSTMATNLAIAVLAATMIWLVGLGPFLLVQLPITLLAGSIGVWLFYIQHQFEDTFWARDEGWNFHEAALHGSSHYDLPSVLRWFTRQYRGAPCPPSLQPYPVLPIATSVTGSPRACCRRAAYAVPEPPVRAHGSLGRKEAAAHFLSRDAYSQVGDEQKDGRRSKSGIVIFSLVATPQRKTRPSTGRRRPAFRYFRRRHSDAAPNREIRRTPPVGGELFCSESG